MATRVGLTLLRTHRQAVATQDGQTLEVWRERVKALLVIGRRSQRIRESLVDTGAVLTVFPRSVWTEFEGEIDWVDVKSETKRRDWTKSITGLSGGSVPCRLGRVQMRIVDLEGRQ